MVPSTRSGGSRHQHQAGMSKKETPLTRAYWRRIGGTLVEEFLVVEKSPTNGARLVDAIILPNEEDRIAGWREVDLRGKEVIVVQTKASRLGMYLMGQAVFSAELVRKFEPASIRSVALCTANDSVLAPLLEDYSEVEVVVIREDEVDE